MNNHVVLVPLASLAREVYPERRERAVSTPPAPLKNPGTFVAQVESIYKVQGTAETP